MNIGKSKNCLLLIFLSLVNCLVSYSLFFAQPIEQLTQILPDDAFYYLQIAKNIAHGHGISFDGFYPTNGFHPLWLILITPFAFIFKSNASFLYACLGIGTLFNILSIYVLFSIMRIAKLSSFATSFTLILFSLSPFYLSQANNGLETALNIFSILLFCRTYISLSLVNKPFNCKNIIMLALSCSAMLLSRLDNIFLALSIFSFLTLYRWKDKGHIFISGLVITLIMAPYLYWNLKNFGHFVPISGMIETYRTKESFLINHDPSLAQEHLLQLIKMYFSEILIANFSSKYLFYCFILFIIAYSYSQHRVNELKSSFKYALPLIIGLLVQIASIELRWMVRPWYYLSSYPTLIIIFLLFLLVIRQDNNGKFYQSTIAPTVLAIFINLINLQQHWHNTFGNFNINQKTMYEAVLWMNKNIPDRKIGVFNSGIIGYFYKGNIINLDGVVNNQALSFIKNHNLMGYILNNHIDYLADLNYAINDDNVIFLGPGYIKNISLIKKIKNRNQANNDFLVYKVIYKTQMIRN